LKIIGDEKERILSASAFYGNLSEIVVIAGQFDNGFKGNGVFIFPFGDI